MEGLGKIKKVAKRVGDTAGNFETKAEPFVDGTLGRLKRSPYTLRIITGLILVAIAVGWWAAS